MEKQKQKSPEKNRNFENTEDSSFKSKNVWKITCAIKNVGRYYLYSQTERGIFDGK